MHMFEHMHASFLTYVQISLHCTGSQLLRCHTIQCASARNDISARLPCCLFRPSCSYCHWVLPTDADSHGTCTGDESTEAELDQMDCVAVINRPHDSALTLEEASEHEAPIFKALMQEAAQPCYQLTAEQTAVLHSKCGISALANLVNTSFYDFVKHEWAAHSDGQIEAKIAEAHGALHALGAAASDTAIANVLRHVRSKVSPGAWVCHQLMLIACTCS